MKSPLDKLRKLGPSRSEPEENWDHLISAQMDGLTQAAKDMKDMRTCYDGLLSAAAATANSAYEFSESWQEMGNCLLEKTAVHDDGECGYTLSQLGRVQFELQKLVDGYRSQIVMTITHPSESLLSELRKVEEMKLQCDEKKEMFEYMVEQFREKRKSRHGKGETFTSKQLHAVREEYDEAARLCVFRVASLKQGQCRSLLTQAARHHAAQLNFFRKGLQSLEAVEPHIRNVIEKQHIDCELSELNECEEGGDEKNSFETNEDEELSFENTNTVRNSMEVDTSSGPSHQIPQAKSTDVHINIPKNQGDQALSRQHRAGSHSAPLYADKSDPLDRIREIRTPLPKFSGHILPTPENAKGSITSSILPSSNVTAVPSGGTSSKNQWHSSPLDIENTNKKHFLPLPRPQSEISAVYPLETQIKRQAFSGPIVSKQSSSISKPLLPPSLNVSLNAPPPLVSSPKISELHELPRPPDSSGSKYMHYREASRNPLRERSPLPLPHLTVSRSFSIPTSSHRTRAFNSGKLLDVSQISKGEEGHSPPITPMSLSNVK